MQDSSDGGWKSYRKQEKNEWEAIEVGKSEAESILLEGMYKLLSRGAKLKCIESNCSDDL